MDWFDFIIETSIGDRRDCDGDGYSNEQEEQLGQEATIVDEVEGGGMPGDCPRFRLSVPPWF